MNIVAILTLVAAHCRGDLITFESDPYGNTPIDDAELSDTYAISGGTVQFFFDTNGDNTFNAGIDIVPRFEDYGDDGGTEPTGTTGFLNDATGQRDTAAAGFSGQLGNWFLRQSVGGGSVFHPFIVQYDTTETITAMSGEIWDIDGNPVQGTEQWLVEVLNGSGTVIASSLSPLGDSVSGAYQAKPWNFGFINLSDNASRLRISFIGTKTSNIGLAFNNFVPDFSAVPEPGSGLLAFAGLFWGICTQLRRRRNETLLTHQLERTHTDHPRDRSSSNKIPFYWCSRRIFLGCLQKTLACLFGLFLIVPIQADIIVIERESMAELRGFAGSGGATEQYQNMLSTTALAGSFSFSDSFNVDVSATDPFSTGAASATGSLTVSDNLLQASSHSLLFTGTRSATGTADWLAGNGTGQSRQIQTMRVRFQVSDTAVQYHLTGFYDPGATFGLVGEANSVLLNRPFTAFTAFNVTTAGPLNLSGVLNPGFNYEFRLRLNDFMIANSSNPSVADASSFNVQFALSSVPEPSGIALATGAYIALLFKRRRS
jgi:hypothetical protein